MAFDSGLFVFLLFVFGAAVWLLLSYNTLVALRQRCLQAKADIDVQLHQRHDLIPNLVATVEGYAAHERDTLDAVLRARGAAVSDGGTAEGMLEGALGRLFALAEAYPDLKADANFRRLQDQLGEVEDRIAAARRFLNNAAAEYNAAIEAFPAVLYARTFGFDPSDFHETGIGRATLAAPPKVGFERRRP